MKRITSIITLLSLFFVMCFPSLANSSSSENSFKDYMYDIYIDPSSYTLTNSNGEDITNSFIENTRGFFISNNWEAIDEYFLDNVIQAEKVQVSWQDDISLTSIEHEKSVTKSYISLRDVDVSGHPTYNGSRARVFHEVTGILYYDEALSNVTRALNPTLNITKVEILSDMHLEQTYTESITNRYYTISSGRSSVTYSITFYVSAVLEGMYYTKYQPISQSFTLSV